MGWLISRPHRPGRAWVQARNPRKAEPHHVPWTFSVTLEKAGGISTVAYCMKLCPCPAVCSGLRRSLPALTNLLPAPGQGPRHLCAPFAPPPNWTRGPQSSVWTGLGPTTTFRGTPHQIHDLARRPNEYSSSKPHVFLQCEGPKIAKLVYNSNKYGLWYL